MTGTGEDDRFLNDEQSYLGVNNDNNHDGGEVERETVGATH